jgi:membrane-bound serine protease (ClpP class)
MRRRFLLPIMLPLLCAPASGLAQGKVVYRLTVAGEINLGLSPYIARGLKEAEAKRASAVILDLDTPGGRVDAAERVVDAVRGSRVPVYAFVNPRAYSAGALIALATKGIYMRPGAVLGAATPVSGEGVKAPEKYVSAMRGEFRALAEERGLDPRIAEAMVDEQIGVPGLVEPGQLLTMSTSEALRVHFAKAEVDDQPALLDALGLAGAELVTVSPNWAEAVVQFLTSPIVSSLLLSLGILGLLTEIKAGAHGLGLLVSLVALGLFFGSSLLLGLAGWEVLLLLGLGVLALGIEVFATPGTIIPGLIGAALIGSSMVLAMSGTSPTGADLLRALAVLGASIGISAAVIYAWVRHLPSSNRFSGLLLRSATHSSEGFISAPVRHDLVGQEGVSLTDLRPSGMAKVGGERLDVVTEGEYIPAGQRIKVLRSEGYRHVVAALS